ncbi:hypothetical protein Q5752_000509 [Cryptotrichosporon argae]
MPELHPLVRRVFEAAGVDPSTLSVASPTLARGPAGAYYTKHAWGGAAVAQVRGEAAGLRAMRQTACALVPAVLGVVESADGEEAGMVSEYFELGRGGVDQGELGRAVARMHRVPGAAGGDADGKGEDERGRGCQDGERDERDGPERWTGRYGFGCSTHCGVTRQDNTWADDWETFFRDRRLGDLVERMADVQVADEWERLKTRAVPLLLHAFDPPARPVILHGDLWSGNVGVDARTGRPVAYDPASYYGHGEADLGITHMFGGFSDAFYDAYHAVHPRSAPYYAERQKLYELYHHLNHALMFGGGYRAGALRIMRDLVTWTDGVDA